MNAMGYILILFLFKLFLPFQLLLGQVEAERNPREVCFCACFANGRGGGRGTDRFVLRSVINRANSKYWPTWGDLRSACDLHQKQTGGAGGRSDGDGFSLDSLAAFFK